MFRLLINSILKTYGRQIIESSRLETLNATSFEHAKYERWMEQANLSPTFRDFIFTNIRSSTSQLQQDLVAQYVALSTDSDQRYFVEFGACDGKILSNTYLLEKAYGWQGILAEPCRSWHERLIDNRSAKIDFRCLSPKGNSEIEFFEAENAEYSTLSEFRASDLHSQIRLKGKKYIVPSVSLIDLLHQHGAPSTIDYLSVDTEGSEFSILQEFNFSLYKFNMISVEHNFSDNRSRVFNLLSNAGYARYLEHLSLFEDWYFPVDFNSAFFYR